MQDFLIALNGKNHFARHAIMLNFVLQRTFSFVSELMPNIFIEFILNLG